MAEEKDKKPAKKAEGAGAPAAKKPEAKKGEGKKAEAAKPAAVVEALPKDYVPRLRKHYDEVVKPKLMAQFGYKNVMEVPRLSKIVLNMGIGEATQDSKLFQVAAAELEKIAGQKVVVTKSRKAIAQFKIRENLAIGAKVTLRKVRMYEFLERLIRMALPRIRDFRGVSPKSFDGNGNYTLGVSDLAIFPEIELDKIKRNVGFDVTIVTSATCDSEAKALLSELGMPFSDRKTNSKKLI